MEAPPRPPPRRPRPAPASFRPQFTLLLVYFFVLFGAFALLLALPALIETFRALPPGSGPITAEEQALAADTARQALRGRVPIAVVATVVVLGLGVWTRTLPGFRHRR